MLVFPHRLLTVCCLNVAVRVHGQAGGMGNITSVCAVRAQPRRLIDDVCINVQFIFHTLSSSEQTSYLRRKP